MIWKHALNNSKRWFFNILVVGSISVILFNTIFMVFLGISYFEQREAFELCMQNEINRLEPRLPIELGCYDIFYDSNFFFDSSQIFNILVAIFVGFYAYSKISSEDLSLRHESTIKRFAYFIGCVMLVLFLIFYVYAYIVLFKLMNLGLEALEGTKETYRNLLN